jgi:hypothetical protein
VSLYIWSLLSWRMIVIVNWRGLDFYLLQDSSIGIRAFLPWSLQKVSSSLLPTQFLKRVDLLIEINPRRMHMPPALSGCSITIEEASRSIPFSSRQIAPTTPERFGSHNAASTLILHWPYGGAAQHTLAGAGGWRGLNLQTTAHHVQPSDLPGRLVIKP